MPERYDVIVAGAGIAGLSLAALLSVEGRYSVLLLESGSAPGGRFRVTRRNGYLLDWGVHACLLGSRGAIGKVLRRIDSVIRIRPAGMAIFRYEKLLPFIGESLISVAGQKVLGGASLVRFGSAALASRGKRSFDTTVSGWLERNNSNDDLKTMLESLSIGLLATDQYERASAGELFAFFRQVMRRGVAAGYPEGGWGPVLDALLEAVNRSSRCEVRLGTRLERIAVINNRVESVTAGGQDIEAGAVVCALPPQSLAGEVDIDHPLPEEYRRRLSSLEESVGLCIEMGLSAPITEDKRIIFSVDPPALLWAVSNISPAVAPPGKQLLQFFSPLDQERRCDKAFIEKRTDELIDLAGEAYGGTPEEEFKRVMVTTIGSVVPFAGQSRPHRPGMDVPGYDGLFLIGDGVNCSGLGGDLAARSAIQAERLLDGYLRGDTPVALRPRGG